MIERDLKAFNRIRHYAAPISRIYTYNVRYEFAGTRKFYPTISLSVCTKHRWHCLHSMRSRVYTTVAAGRGTRSSKRHAPRATLCRGRHFGGGQKYGILKFSGFWRFGVCIAERTRREFALHAAQLSVLFVTVRANAVVVTITISIADLIGGSGNTGKTPANTLAPLLRVYVTVSCPSVCLSVPSFDRSSGVRGGWLLSAMRHEGRRY